MGNWASRAGVAASIVGKSDLTLSAWPTCRLQDEGSQSLKLTTLRS